LIRKPDPNVELLGFWETPEARAVQAKKVKATEAAVKAMKKKTLDNKRKVKF